MPAIPLIRTVQHSSLSTTKRVALVGALVVGLLVALMTDPALAEEEVVLQEEGPDVPPVDLPDAVPDGI